MKQILSLTTVYMSFVFLFRIISSFYFRIIPLNSINLYFQLTLVKQRDKLEVVFKHFLMEDRGADGSPSYVDFLCHMHKEIRNLLS